MKKAIKIDPNKHSYYSNLSLHYRAKGDTDTSLDLLKKSLEIKEDDPTTWVNMGSTYGLRKDLDSLLFAATLGAAPAAAERVTVTGEVIDSWCYLTEIMYPLGSAHHQCAIWCAAGGIPTAILDDDGTVYIVLAVEGDGAGVANPALLDIQSHRVTVEGDAFERDGMSYLVI